MLRNKRFWWTLTHSLTHSLTLSQKVERGNSENCEHLLDLAESLKLVNELEIDIPTNLIIKRLYNDDG